MFKLLSIFAVLSVFNGETVSGREKLYIGGLFPLTNGWFESLGNQCLQSALLAVEHVNNNTDILPDYEIVPVFNDTMVSTNSIIFPPKLAFKYFFQSTWLFGSDFITSPSQPIS